MTENPNDPRIVLTSMVNTLGLNRKLMSAMSADVEDAQKALEATDEWKELRRLKSTLADTSDSAKTLEDQIREKALEIAIELQDKNPAPGISITQKTKFEIVDDVVLVEHCKEKHPALIVTSVDKKKLEKIVVALGEEHNIPGVTLTIEAFGQTKIATGYAKLLDSEDQEND